MQRATGPRLLRDGPQPARFEPRPHGRWSNTLTTRLPRHLCVCVVVVVVLVLACFLFGSLIFIVFGFVSSVLGKRLAGKRILEVTYFVSSEMDVKR